MNNANTQQPEHPEGGILKETTKDSHSRSFVKGVSWRIIASFTTVSIAWFVTGDTKLALEIGAIEIVAKIVIYYGHERIWLSI